ncbi:hypothetical protein GCM10011371_20140 [Novosphingobium marinum]|uniref:DUF2171 domain-containing protein n=1 Tax=Novosphingobium marinum TaxID=1514948 RepID=A0A7Z0BTL4_9SPHN|nr:DUF2171 domain-containing protein [Novosphingobium marinum]NYH96126.1 hypothetical protein [Novosphingobium marinum]GGC32687.1 hypothetical protein GCM10011371_20140 [Novosphingobium marinum]
MASAARKPERFQTQAGTIEQGMEVVDADEKHVGIVDKVANGQIALSRADETGGEQTYIPLSLIDGIGEGKVILAGRGDASFGVEAAH